MKVLIAEDEWIERKSIRKLIENNLQEMEVVAEAKNGREAVELVKEVKPDIILMDIKMPGMTGIEAVKEIKEFNPNVKIAMVSAYDSFEYAKEAMHYGIKDYILKPSDQEEIVQALLRMKKEIESKQARDQLTAQTKSLSRLNFLKRALNHHSDKSLIIDQKNLFPQMQAIYFLVIMSEGNIEDHVKMIIQDVADDDTIISLEADYIIVCMIHSDEVQNKDILSLAQQLHYRLGKGYYIGAGHAQTKISQAYKSFNQAYSASYKLKNDRQRAFGFLQNEKLFNDEEINHVISLLEIGQIDEAYLFFVEHGSYTSEAHREQLYLHIKQKLSADHVEFFTTTFTQLKTQTDWKQFFHVCAIEFQKIYQRNQSIEKVKQYIAVHYQEHVTLEELADLVRLSPNYFSNLFKQQTGKTLTDYITTVRMKQAKRFIIENKLTLKEISYLVGYKDPNYFSRVFKKYYKQSPKQFQQAIFK